MIIEGMHYNENCECEGCKRVSGKSKKIGRTIDNAWKALGLKGKLIAQAIAEERERVRERVEELTICRNNKGVTEIEENTGYYKASEITSTLQDKPLTDISFTKTTVGTDSPDGHTDTINEKQEVVCSHYWQMSCYDNFVYYSSQAVVICIHCGQLKRIKIQQHTPPSKTNL